MAATFEPGATVAAVARERGLNANLVFAWRGDPRFNADLQRDVSGDAEGARFLPVEISEAAAVPPQTGHAAARLSSGEATIKSVRLTLPCGTELRIDGGPDITMLVQLIRGLLA